MAIRVNDKITFIHIGKNAGTSISRILETRFKIKETGITHDGYYDIPAEWRDNCFCVIRNPFDRLLSLYYFTIQKMRKLSSMRWSKRTSFYEPQFRLLEKGFQNFVVNEAETSFYTKPVNMDRKQSWSVKTQVSMLPRDRSKIQMLRFENLQDDWKELCVKQGLEHYKLPRINTTRSDSAYRDHYNERMIEEVKKHWKEDIELGDYEF